MESQGHEGKNRKNKNFPIRYRLWKVSLDIEKRM